jgi:beta-glucanase (GH16 family)
MRHRSRPWGSFAARPTTLIRSAVACLMVAAVATGISQWGSVQAQSAAPHAQPVASTPPDHLAMPHGDPPGWQEVFSDDFSGPRLNRDAWRLYWGQPGGDPTGWYEPSHVAVRHGMLQITASRDRSRGGRWATGGVSSSPKLTQTYGKYLVRMRMDRGEGVGHAIVLWPANNRWPPEIDFSEDNGSGRDNTLATVHYGKSDHHIASLLKVDLTQWHTLGVEWLPGSLQFTLDGRSWFHVTGDSVPSIPMVLDMQSQTWPCHGTWGRCPHATTPPNVRLDVDWVAAYAPTSALRDIFASRLRRLGKLSPRPASTGHAG